jgi:hypothetical protein
VQTASVSVTHFYFSDARYTVTHFYSLLQVKLVANIIYNFKNTYCGSDVSIQNKTNTDNKYKSLAGESFHFSSCDFELICLTLLIYFAFLPYKFKTPLFHFLQTLQNVRMTGAYLNASSSPGPSSGGPHSGPGSGC